MYKLIISFLFLAIATISSEASSLGIQPTYNNFIGYTIVQFNEIDSALSISQSGALYDNEKYGINICGNDRYFDKNSNSKYFYVFFTKIEGYQGPNPIEKILDIVNIDMSKFPKDATIWLDECDCKGLKYCNTVAIYHHDEEMAAKGIMVTPLKVWRPNIATGKLEEISPNSVRCGSEPPPEED